MLDCTVKEQISRIFPGRALGKRLVALTLAVCTAAFALAGCGGKEDRTDRRGSVARHERRSDREEARDAEDHTRPPKNVEPRRDVVSGDWELPGEDDEFAGFYIFRLDYPIDNCESFCVDYEVSIASGGPCDEWMAYVRSYGQWYEVGSVYLTNGRADQRLTLDTPRHIDALALYPMVEGDMEWNDSIEVYDPRQAADSDYVEDGGVWLEGGWSDQQYHINDCDTWAFVLDQPIQNCRKLRVSLSIEMQHNTSCENWSIYVWNGSSWNSIGNFYLPGGNGDAVQDIVLDNPMTVSMVTAVPKIPGSYSWNSGIAVCDLS